MMYWIFVVLIEKLFFYLSFCMFGSFLKMMGTVVVCQRQKNVRCGSQCLTTRSPSAPGPRQRLCANTRESSSLLERFC